MRDLHGEMKRVAIGEADLARERSRARQEIVRQGMPRLMAEIDAGRWGFTRIGLDLLDLLETALAAGLEAGSGLTQLMRAPASDEPFADPRELTGEERRFVALFAARVAAVEGAETTATLADTAVRIENRFDLEDVRKLLDAPLKELSGRLLRDLAGFVRFHRSSSDPAQRVDSAASLGRCVHAYWRLLGDTVTALADETELRHLRSSLERVEIEILGRRYEGFDWRSVEAEEEPSGLLPITVDDIVGNEEYLQACMRTARDVAGFDFESGRNPKTINPVLFALGRPGCGKTVTAHAVGNYFLEFCRQRGVPARFLSIRRTDWASSYQNASANALVRIFREDVGAYPGAVGVYWPDIDTAFAARGNPGIRSEERNILGASFGVFDGTLLEPNGKWFMMCDANFMHMDEATISRITQEPYLLEGAKTPEEIVRLFRDVKLRDHRHFLELDDEEWLGLGARCRQLDLSGRSLANIARRVIATVQDFEYPDEYYQADFERRREIIAERSRRLDADGLQQIVERHGAFEQEADERASRERFEGRVDEIVLNLSARQTAIDRLAPDPGAGTGSGESAP